MAKQAHLQAILSAVDRLTPTLNKIAATTARTKGLMTTLNSVNLNKLRGTFKVINKSVTDVGSAASDVAGKLLPLVGLGALSVAGLGLGFLAASRGAMQYSAGIQDASEMTGESVTNLQLLQGAFRMGGVEAEAANDAIVKFNKGMAEAAAGKDKSFAALMTRLRIPLRDAKGQIRGMTEVLPELSDAFAKNTNPAVRTRIAMELFGKSGSKLIGTLAQGGQSLKDLFAELESSGRILSSGAVGRLDKLDENLEELGVRYKVLSGEILSRAAPAMQRLVERMQGWISANREVIAQRLGNVIERVANTFTAWIESGGFERLTTEIRRVWTVLGEFVDRLGGLGGVLKLVGALILAGPVASLFLLGGALARLGVVLLPLVMSGLAALLGPLATLFSVLRAGQVVLLGMSLTFGQLALLAAPFLVAAVAIAGAAYLIYRNWDVVGPMLSGVWEGIKNGAAAAWNGLRAVLSWSPMPLIARTWGAIEPVLAGIWAGITTAATVAWNVLRFAFSWSPVGIIVNNWGAITAVLNGVWEGIKAGAAAAWGVLRAVISWTPLGLIVDNWGAITTWVGGFWENLSAVASAGVAVIGAVLQSWNPLALVRAAWEPVIGFLTGAWERISNIIGPALRMIGGAADRVSGAFNEQFGAQASNRSYGPRFDAASPAPAVAGGPATPARQPTPLVQAGAMQASARVQGEMRVRFENAPPGMRVDPGKTNSSGLGFNPDVGYRSMGGLG